MSTVSGGSMARRARSVIAVGLMAVLLADLAVAIENRSPGSTQPGAARLTALLSPSIAGRAQRPHAPKMDASNASVVPQTAAATSHHKKKKKQDDSVAGAVLGVVNTLTTPTNSSPPSSGRGGHHPKGGGSPPSGGSGTPPAPSGRPAPRQDLQWIPSTTLLATLKHNSPGFSSAHSNARSMTVPRAWYGRTTTMPVVAQTRTRLRVMLARRPDESTIWIRRRSATLSTTRYALLVDLSKRRLYMFNGGRQVGSYPVGVGLPQTPTPTGTYFLAFHAPPNGPGYGAVMLETSAHSKVFQSFEGGNDAIIAIHGPIDATANREIGRNGARVSNGCIRMHDGELIKVAKVPDGTPIILHP